MRNISKFLIPTFVVGLVFGWFGLAAGAATVTVQSGDTLWGIAQEHDDVTVDELKELNSELDPYAIPVGTKVVISHGENTKDNGIVTHVVQPGNTLSEIAQAYDGVTLEDLYELNEGIDPYSLTIGSDIVVVNSNNSSPANDVIYHTVQPGNTLYGIASVYDYVSVEDIILANPEIDPRSLQIGSKIAIPLE